MDVGYLVMMRGKSGFTIVELLIVIVVIAILAAITIVAYNGIQDRAKNTQVVTTTASYVKTIRAYYAANNDTIPMQTTAVQCFDGTACWGGSSAASGESLRTELKKISPGLPTVPAGRAILITNGTTTDAGSSTDYSGWYVLYQVINMSNQCPAVSGLRYLNGGNTGDNLRNCRAALEF